jgi:hypothetical protein
MVLSKRNLGAGGTGRRVQNGIDAGRGAITERYATREALDIAACDSLAARSPWQNGHFDPRPQSGSPPNTYGSSDDCASTRNLSHWRPP